MPEQSNWHFCKNCHALFFGGYGGGVCTVGGRHIVQGLNFVLPHDEPSTPTAQADWRFCEKCHVMFFNGYGGGNCPVGGSHKAQGANFVLPHDVASTSTAQPNWHFCQKCHAMFFNGYGGGRCPVDGTHQAQGANFVLPHTVSGRSASARLTIDQLLAIMPRATRAQAERFFDPLVRMMAANNINTRLRMAHFLAQVGHESGDLRHTEEIASGAQYEGRADLGNSLPGDGPRFKGRGLIQLTGRANYRTFGIARHQDFVTGRNNELLATDPNLAVDVACFFWTTHNLNPRADLDDLVGITRSINGGLNGLDDRRAHLRRAKQQLSVR